ncbi:MAG TPA: response regulator [Salinivirga sp.]|uniref:response regulator transcription factor n=1 Tax=Salinivirga sp. TaxID=1970192 RepID=UPI002B4893C8|nr:response regulator [Salinivirga sp.]HKK60023.1 response regulator [Salinivirga sp.]
MKKILLVDDEPNIVMALEYSLKKKGYEVLIARDGEEAIKLFENIKPCLVILDIMMPKMDGFEVLEKIKEDEDDTSKVIFLSAKNKEEDIQKGLDAGADDYFTKPFSTKKLLDKIQSIY